MAWITVSNSALNNGCRSQLYNAVRYRWRLNTANKEPIKPSSITVKRLWVSHMARTNPLNIPSPAAAKGPSKPPASIQGMAEKIIMVEPGGFSGNPGTGREEPLENSRPMKNAVASVTKNNTPNSPQPRASSFG